MLQVSYIRQHKETVLERLAVKNFSQTQLVNEIIELDDERKKATLEVEGRLNIRKTASKEIGDLMKSGKKEDAEQKKDNLQKVIAELPHWEGEVAKLEKVLTDKLLLLPNLPSTLVPKGKTPEENEVVKEGGTIPTLYENSQPHWELTTKYKLIDFELGTKITGSGFPVYTGKGAKLQRSLIQYFLDYNTAAGYTEYLPPFMVNEESAYGTGSLPDKEGQMYHATADNLYLIPTSEVPVTNVYRDSILKDVRGLNRLHQFEKVEIVQIAHPDKSYDTLNEMVAHVEKLLQSLELPYRILRLCGGDMSFTSALTYDFEVYSAAQNRWLEVSSVSNFENFQANRLKCRFKDGNSKTQLVHTLNGSSLALPRIVASLLENNQTPDGIMLPKVLHNYFGGDRIG
jgi:seryl-tRNA synthetase